MIKYPHFLILFFIISQFCLSQNSKEIDSLLQIVKNSSKDSLKVSILNKIAFKYIFNDESKARQIIRQSEKIAQNSKLKFGYNEVVNIKGIINDVSGQSDSACFYFTKSLKLSKENKFKTLEVRSVNNLGMYYFNNGKNSEALKYFFEAVKINSSLPKDKQINESICNNNIGLIYQSMNLFEKALPFHNKALSVRIEKNMIKDQVSSYNNLGICYRNINNNKKALEYFNKGLSIIKQTNDQVEYFKIIENLASIYIDEKKHKKAIEMLLELNNKDRKITIEPKSKLGNFSKLSACYVAIGQSENAIKYCKLGLSIIKSNPSLEIFATDIYRFYGAANYSIGNDVLGDEYLKKYFELNKKIFSNKTSSNIADLEVKYETEKKEKELLKSKAQIVQKEIETKQITNQLIIATIIALAFLVIGYLVYRQQKQKNAQIQQENKLKAAIAEIENQNKLQEQRLSISRDLHDNIGAQLTFIISSVDNVKYGFDITNQKLDNKLTNISSFAKDTILELRDTIWAMNSNEISYEDLEIRINNFIEKAKLSQENISFSFAIDESLKTKKLSSVEGMNVYRTIQEAINNSLKYAAANVISVNIKPQTNKTLISIKDNGKGFDIETIEKGNGLKNMQKRIEEIKGKFDLYSDENGTKIEILI